MILSLWNYIAGAFIRSGLVVFPQSNGFPQEYLTAFSEVTKPFYIVEPVLPYKVLIGCVIFLIGFEIAILLFTIGRWVASHIPVVGGKGP